MTTVNITPTVLDTTQWNEANYTWGDVGYSTETWAAAAETNFLLEVGEDWVFVEAISKNVSKNGLEILAFFMDPAFNFGKELAESFNTIDTYTDIVAFNLGAAEGWTTNDSLGNTFGLMKSETIDYVENLANAFDKSLVETLDFLEEVDLQKFFNLDVAESFSFAEAYSKTFGLNPSETLTINDFIFRKGLCRISDLVLSSGDLTEVDFQNEMRLGRPAGYEDFRRYISGFYNYEEAVYRVVMESTTSVDKPKITELKLEVDVPDLFETGIATISASPGSGVAITFNKDFHVTPDINLTVKSGGSGVTATYDTESSTGFTAYILDASGTAVTGTVSWAVRGY